MLSQSIESTFEELDQLHILCRRDPELAAYMAAELRDFKQTLRKAGSAKDRQIYLAGEMQKATVECHAELAKGRDLASRLRSGVVSFFGPRSPKLAAFKITRWKPTLGKRT